MFSHAAIERGTAEAELRGSQRDVTLMAREGAFDGAPLYGVQMLRFFLAARAGDIGSGRDRRNQFVIAPGLEDEIRSASLECFHSECNTPIRSHQHHGETRVERLDASQRIQAIAATALSGHEVHIEQYHIEWS